VKKYGLTLLFWGIVFAVAARPNCFYIKDKSNNIPVQAAVVIISTPEGKNTICLPDYNGKVNLPATLSENSAIEVKCLGYVSQTIKLSDIKEDTVWMIRNHIDLNQVAITSNYSPAPVMQSAYAVKIIGKEDFKQMAAVNVADIMKQQLNYTVGYDQAFGSTLSMSGMDMKNIKVLVDGVPVIGRLNGNLDLSQFNLSQIERIEIVEGPMSAAYGTDAIAGVINLITKPDYIQKTNASASAYYESIGTYNTDINTSLKLKHSGIRISAGRNFFDGWNLTDNRRVYEWKPKEQYYGSAGITTVLNKIKLSYQLNWFDEKLTDKGPVTITPFTATAYDTYYKTIRMNHTAGFDWFCSEKNKVNGHLSYSDYNRNKKMYLKDMTTLSQTELATSEFRDTTLFSAWNLRSAFNHVDDSKNINFQTGIEVNIEKGSGKRIQDAKPMQEYAIFASAEYSRIHHLLIRPGIRYAYHSDFNIPLIPSINLKYDISKNQNVRASYSRGFRTPGIKERYLDFVDINHNIQGNDALKPETSDNIQLSYCLSSSFNKTVLATELKLFYNNVRNLITLASFSDSSNLYTYINIGHFVSQGAEWSGKLSFKNITCSAGFAYTGTSAQNESLINTLSWYPQVNGSLSYAEKFTGIGFNVLYKYNGAMDVYSINNEGNKVRQTNDSYQLLDASINKAFWANKIEVSTGIKNILNVTDVKRFATGEIHSSGSQSALLPGRLFFLKLMITL
jgi:outer membrane receptor for ferrienterochelin and colicins